MGYGSDLQSLGLLGGGAEGFIKGWQDADDRKMRQIEQDAKFKSQESDRERQRSMDDQAKAIRERQQQISLKTAGLELPEGQSMDEIDISKLKYSQDYLAKIQAQASASAGADPFGSKAQSAKNAVLEGQQKAFEIQNAAREQKRKTLSPLEGYEKSDEYRGTPEEEKNLRTASSDLYSFNTTIDSLKEKVKAASTKDLANPLSDAQKGIKNDLRDLQLIYKGPAFAQLGVLAGPDMAILDQVIENPGTVSNLFSGKDGVLQRYEQAKARVQGRFGAKTKSLGLVKQGLVSQPKGLVSAPAQAASEHPADSAAVKWAKENPKDPRSAAILKANGL